MNKRQISTGEAAKISGLTIRTLQHYDNIGVLPASGRTDGGHRFYTESDIIKLEYIVFYRGLGFPLEQIKERLTSPEIGENASDVLSVQKTMLYNQIYSIQNSIVAIEASQEIMAVGKITPWALLATFMQSLGTVDVSTWSNFHFTEEQIEIFNAHFQALDDLMDFYNTWKRLSVKAAAFYEAGVKPDESIAQKLAMEWESMVEKVTGGNKEHEQAYLAVDSQRDMWSKAERELIEKAEPFLEEVIKIYCQNRKRG